MDEELRRRAEARVGSVIGGKYRIDQVLGIGGMAVVYGATHRNQKRVAIKMLHPELSLSGEARSRFLREGYAANSVDHPGAVAVLDDDTAEDGSAFLVMERLEGEEVERLAGRLGGRLDARVALGIAEPLLAVLEAAHAKGVVHRDIKPANLYVTRDGSVKVLDFGIARARDAMSGAQRGTQTGMLMGTPAFMAPEQALGKSSDIDGATDLWAVGATLFTLLSGQQVHEGETSTALLVCAATQQARSLAQAMPGTDPRLVAVVDRALAFHKAARWRTASEMLAAVRDAHQALFGAPPNKETLAALVTPSMAVVPTVLASSEPPRWPATGANGGSPAGQPSAPYASFAPSAVPAPSSPSNFSPPQAPGWGGTGAPSASAVPPAPQKRPSLLVPACILGLAIVLGCGVIGFMATRATRRGDVAQAPAPSATAGSTIALSASPVAAQPASVGASGASGASLPSASASGASAPASRAPVTAATRETSGARTTSVPARTPAVTTKSMPPTPAAPATEAPPSLPPPPALAPAAARPAPMCKAQCVDVARSCKSRCSERGSSFHERHVCKQGCDEGERECRAHAGC